jgi:UDP-N-acetylmuramate--alanine ligase
MPDHNKNYVFCGVGGSGMSALAKIMLAKGANIIGTDRNYDAGRFENHFQDLKNAGVQMMPQDGSDVTDETDYLVVSSAVEPKIPDVQRAKDFNIPIIKRAELLAEICNASQSICVAGTNGKSTVTGMVGWMLSECGVNPSIINGGGMINFDRDNAVTGQGDTIVAETDESDGTVILFTPHIAVLTNISEDHKDLDELMAIFKQFLDQSDYQILNRDCPNVRTLINDYPDALTYSVENNVNALSLIVPGKHNISNAMAALRVAEILGINLDNAKNALNEFKGITSRLEVIGKTNNITVIDDFGHNPDKIEAGLKTLKDEGKRLVLMYQPHGFKPTRDHRDELISVFTQYLTDDDLFFMPDILYFGGTVDQDISSLDIINPLKEKGINANHIPEKLGIKKEILKQAKPEDIICIMGARDDSLREMARDIYQDLIRDK